MAAHPSPPDLREVPFLLVLLTVVVAIGYALAEPQHWLRAVGTIAVALVAAGLLRLVLSDEQAGMLRVRRRTFDVLCYWAFAGLVMIFALALPQR